MQSVHAATVFTGRSVERDRYIVFDGATLKGVSASRRGELVGECAVVTPAFIDAHSHIGIHRHGHPGA